MSGLPCSSYTKSSSSAPPMPCTAPPAIWPSTTDGLIMTPQSSLTMYRSSADRTGVRIDLDSAKVACVRVHERRSDLLYRFRISRPGSIPGGKRAGSRYATRAISATVRDLVGVPRTLATPSTRSMSSGDASNRCAAIVDHFAAELLRCTAYRGTEDRSAPAPARTERVGRLARVALVHRDIVERDTEELAHELRGRGLEPLSVGSRPEVHVDGAIRLHTDVRGLSAVGPDHALRFDVQADADADEPSCIELLALLTRGTRRSRPSTPLARASLPVTRRTGGFRGAACREAHRGAARCDVGARAGRCRAFGQGCRLPVRGSTSRTATARGTARASRCW